MDSSVEREGEFALATQKYAEFMGQDIWDSKPEKMRHEKYSDICIFKII